MNQQEAEKLEKNSAQAGAEQISGK